MIYKILKYKGYQIPVYVNPENIDALKEQYKTTLGCLTSISSYYKIEVEPMISDLFKICKDYIDQYALYTKYLAGPRDGGSVAYIPGLIVIQPYGGGIYGIESTSIVYDSMKYLEGEKLCI